MEYTCASWLRLPSLLGWTSFPSSRKSRVRCTRQRKEAQLGIAQLTVHARPKRSPLAVFWLRPRRHVGLHTQDTSTYGAVPEKMVYMDAFTHQQSQLIGCMCLFFLSACLWVALLRRSQQHCVFDRGNCVHNIENTSMESRNRTGYCHRAMPRFIIGHVCFAGFLQHGNRKIAELQCHVRLHSTEFQTYMIFLQAVFDSHEKWKQIAAWSLSGWDFPPKHTTMQFCRNIPIHSSGFQS
jgi:hypothetical protein